MYTISTTTAFRLHNACKNNAVLINYLAQVRADSWVRFKCQTLADVIGNSLQFVKMPAASLLLRSTTLIDNWVIGIDSTQYYTVFQKKGSHQTFGNNFVKS